MAEFDNQIEGNLRITGELEVVQDVKAPNVQKIESDVKIISSQTTQVIGALGTLIDQAASDAYLTTTEKRAILTKWEEVKTEYPIIRQGAIDDGISSGDALIVNFDGAYTALRTYLLVDPGVLSDMTTGEEIEPVAFVAAWENYYNYRTQLVSARIALKANAADVNTGSYLGMFATAPTDKVTGDWYLNSTDGLIYIWNGTSWTTSGVTWLHKIAAIEDLYSIAASASQVFTSMIVASEAFIEELATKTIKSAALCDDGITPRVEFQLNDAILKFRNSAQSLLQEISDAYLKSYEGIDDTRRAVQLRGDRVSWHDSPDGGTEEELGSIRRLGYGTPRVFLDGEFVGKISTPSYVDASAIVSAGSRYTATLLQLKDQTLAIVYTRISDGYGIQISGAEGSWGSESVIISAMTYDLYACVEANGTDLRLVYRKADGYIYQKRKVGGTWQSETKISTITGTNPVIVLRKSGTFTVIFRRSSDGYPVRMDDSGAGYSSEAVAISGSYYPMCLIELSDESLVITINRASDNFSYAWKASPGAGFAYLTAIHGAATTRATVVETKPNEITFVYGPVSTYYLYQRKYTDGVLGSQELLLSVALVPWDVKMLAEGRLYIIYTDNSSYYIRRIYKDIYSPVITKADINNGKTMVPTITGGTKGTASIDKLFYNITADGFLEGWYKYAQTAAGTAGSGNYTFGFMPSGWQVDFNRLPWVTGRYTLVGNFYVSSAAGETAWEDGQIVVNPSGAFYLKYLNGTASYFVGSARYPLSTATVSYTGFFRIPIKPA